MTDQIIGFIGLGDMGKPMAARLLKHGFRVLSCVHRRREAMDELKTKGMVEKQNPREVAADADTLMTIVIDQAQTETVLRGDDGALAALRPGATIVVMSTLDPGYCQGLAEELAGRNIAVLDCPVSGGNIGAAEGSLAMITGGDEAVVERCRAALETMGTVYHCGAVGMGMVTKLANNSISIQTATLILEAREMACAYGADMEVLMEVCRNGTANSFVLGHWDWVAQLLPQVVDIAIKDLTICKTIAAAKGVRMPMLETHLKKDWHDIAARTSEL